MSEGRAGWPPSYTDALDEDREALGTVLLRLGVDEDTYNEMVALTRDMLRDPEVIRLRDVARAIAAVPQLEAEDIEALCRATRTRSRRRHDMQHLAMKATTTTTTTDQELGQFEALASAWVADRQGDVISRDAFDVTINAWQTSGKALPLLHEHSTTVVGAIDPHSMYASEDGLVVAGKIDRESEEGKAAWRMVKSGTAGFSIGFMSESKPRKGGGRTITEIDPLEVSITATPIHQSTRTLAWKSQPPVRIASFEC